MRARWSKPARWPRCSPRPRTPTRAGYWTAFPCPARRRLASRWATFRAWCLAYPRASWVAGFATAVLWPCRNAPKACRCAKPAAIIAISAGCRRIGSELPRHDPCDRSSEPVPRVPAAPRHGGGPAPGARGGGGGVLAAGGGGGWGGGGG